MSVTVARVWARADGTCDGAAGTLIAFGWWRTGLFAFALGWVLFYIGQRRAYR